MKWQVDMRKVLAFLFAAAFIGAFPVLFYKGIPLENKDLITYMLGQLSGFVGAVFSFYLGSTAGGEKKTEELIRTAKEAGASSTSAKEVKVEGEHVEVTENADRNA